MTGPEDTLARLRAVCDAATPGPWMTDAWRGYANYVICDDNEGYVASVNGARTNWSHNAVFVATFDPPTVRKLLEYVEANEAWVNTGAIMHEPEWKACFDRFQAARRALGLDREDA